ncbi:MAG: hypothetical protein ACOX5R_00790 [bacterium]|jgi:hypothetical protein
MNIHYFHQLKYIFTGLSIVIGVGLFLQLFVEECGGPFPYRTRGPLANKAYYELGELPEWEDVIPLPNSPDNRAELLIQGKAIPPINYVPPPASSQSNLSATQSIQELQLQQPQIQAPQSATP